MKTILLPFHDDEVSRRAFGVAARLAARTGGYVEGLFVMRRPQMIEGGDGDMLADTHYSDFQEEARRVGDLAHARFSACAAEEGLPVAGVAASDIATAGWRELEGMEDHVVGSHGRLFDLVVVGREFGRGWLNWRVVVEAALFDSGRPVLVAPQTAGSAVGENVVIAWNSSTETARTVAFSMPLLARAGAVTVLSVEGWGTPGPSGKELAAYLTRAGVRATARTIPPEGRSPGESVLAECTRVGADLLIKGAYTQSRLRQLIFGGATRHILANAQLPVVFAN